MTLLRVPEWEVIENSFDFCSNRYGKGFSAIVNNSCLFDESTMLMNYIEKNLTDWLSKSKIDTQIPSIEMSITLMKRIKLSATFVENVFQLRKIYKTT